MANVENAQFSDAITRQVTKAIATNNAFPHLGAMQPITDDEQTVDIEPGPFRGRRLRNRVFGVALVFLILLLAIAWWQRNTIADRFVESELESRDVRATYTIDNIGFRTQRIRNLVIGDPASPDLTAKLVEIDVALNFSGASMRDVRASGVIVKGRFADGRLSFGELDKFVDPKSTKPFEWPDIGLVIKNARARIDTPWGVIGAGLHGRGLLRNRFVSTLSLRSPGLAAEGCLVPLAKFDGKLLLEWRQPRLIGLFRAARTTCRSLDIDVVEPVFDADVKLAEGFDKWVTSSQFSAQSASFGEMHFTRPAGKLSLDGGLKRTNFALALEQTGLRRPPLSVKQLALDATGYFGMNGNRIGASARGSIHMARGSLDKGTIRSFRDIVVQTRDTPVGPLMARMAPVLERAGDNFAGQLKFDAFRDFEGRTGATIESLAFDSVSGAKVRQKGKFVVEGTKQRWQFVSPVALVFGGRDLPDVQLALQQSRGGYWGGELAVSPYHAQKSLFAIPHLMFRGTPGGSWQFTGQARLSGPIPGGSISGLNLPIDGTYNGRSFAFYDHCQMVSFDLVTVSTLKLRSQSLRMCPDRGGSMLTFVNGDARFATNLANLALVGSLGDAPIRATSAHLRFNLFEGFAAHNVK
ncbi:MAG: hypothetical protein WBO17_14010, partial [Sphingorhabdus sp.]